jgi:hypothetical protein
MSHRTFSTTNTYKIDVEQLDYEETSQLAGASQQGSETQGYQI